MKGTGDLSSILRLFNLFDCYVIRMSQLTKRLVHNITFNLFLFDWRIQNDVNCVYLQKYSRELHPFSVSSFEQSRHAYRALYVRTSWLSVNSGTDVARSRTRNARRQFRDCPEHSGTVGNPILIIKAGLSTHNTCESLALNFVLVLLWNEKKEKFAFFPFIIKQVENLNAGLAHALCVNQHLEFHRYTLWRHNTLCLCGA